MSEDRTEVTLGELSRGLLALERRINEQFSQVNRRLDNLQFVTREVHEVEMRQLRDRLEDLEEARRWTIRTLVASFIFPLLVAGMIALVVTR